MAQFEACSPEEREHRLDIVRGLLVKGLEQREIVRYCQRQYPEWGITSRQLRNYVYAAVDGLSEEATAVDRAAFFVLTIARYNHIYTIAQAKGDMKSALASVDGLARLLRLNSPGSEFDWRKAVEDAGMNPSNILEQAIEVLSQHSLSSGSAPADEPE